LVHEGGPDAPKTRRRHSEGRLRPDSDEKRFEACRGFFRVISIPGHIEDHTDALRKDFRGLSFRLRDRSGYARVARFSQTSGSGYIDRGPSRQRRLLDEKPTAQMKTDDFPFLSWVGLAKNTRGVLFFSPEQLPAPDKIARLVRRHRYRSLGIPRSLALRIEQQNGADSELVTRLRMPPFVRLPHPFPAAAKAVCSLFPPCQRNAVDALLCSVEYAAPLIFFEQHAASEIAPFCIWERRTATPLDDTEFIRHLRIAAYAVIDFYPLAAPAFALLQRCLAARAGRSTGSASLHEALERLSQERREQAKADGRKRYWRIKEDPQGPRVLAYFDIFPAIARAVLETSGPLPKPLSQETAGLGLGIAAGVWME